MSEIDDALKALNKQYGADSVVKLGDSKVDYGDIDALPTGCYSLDQVFGCGGLPRGRIVEIFGQESSGKSSLALFLAAVVQKNGGNVMWVDAEYAFSTEYAQKIGVDTDKLYLAQPEHMEQALDTINTALKTNGFDLIVLDSVAALVPQAELEGKITDQTMALAARIMGKGLRIMTGTASKTKTAIIFINQLRDKVGVFFGNKHTTPGGNALKFFCSVRIEVKRGQSIKDDKDDVIGNQMICVAVKNKVAAPFRRAELDIYYAKGVDVIADVFDQGVARGVIAKAGNTYSYGETKLGVGREQAIRALQGPTEPYSAIFNELCGIVPKEASSSSRASKSSSMSKSPSS